MFAIMGVTGNVGGAAARHLLAAGHKVRAVLRDQSKAAPWQALGAEIAIASVEDVGALTKAFVQTEGVFVMVPPNFAPDPAFSSARVASANQAAALAAAGAPKAVALSSIGGERESGLGLISQVHILEEALGRLSIPTAILRPGWFMENSLWDVTPARQTGEMASFLQPLDKVFPMVATADIGRVAAQTLTQSWTGRRVIEIEGPKRYSQNEIAALLGHALGRNVAAHLVPRGEWAARFQAQGIAWPQPRVDMLDGFNSGWIDFDPGKNEHITGTVSYETVLADLVKLAA
ncbi:NmrA family NAD(P)-binding protein [Methyloferula stellata]|uniref:NmrA family NAD(P)-binding protein n=1 Tax=Methyloferula stellata TaxID=876270 RepID=UPI0003A4E1BA|nr:NmrA family NAD(P)-binding protein [Methyloferula stellata]